MGLLFISHSSTDRASAEELRERLSREGHTSEGSIFLDFDERNGLRAGQDWEQALYRNIRACRAVIVLCSQSSMASRWCFMEITHARALGKHLFPVRIDDCELDGLLADHQAVDLTHDKEDAYRRLFRGLADAGLDPRNIFLWDGTRPAYPGLLSFEEADAPVFFGRENEIADGLDLLNRVRRLGGVDLVHVLGSSGSGKSSVVRAGLVPRLRRDVERWLVVDPFRPQNDPVSQLADSLSRAFDRVGIAISPSAVGDQIRAACASAEHPAHGDTVTDVAAIASQADMARQLRTLEASVPAGRGADVVRHHLRLARLGLEHTESASGPAATTGESGDAANPLVTMVEELLRASRREQAKVLLVIDQFEELLGRKPDHPANAFLRLLSACTRHRPESRVVVLTTMRSDFLGIFQQCPALAETRHESLPVGPLRNLTPVIVEPARTAGIDLEPGLVETLLNDAKAGDALPLLAFALRELYDRAGESRRLMTIADYDDLGRLEGAVAKSAGQLVAPLTEDRKAQVRGALISLARITEDGSYARRVVRWRDLDPAAHPILEQFVAARLLVSAERSGERVLEVAHEALFRSWDMLRKWLSESAEALRVRKDLETVAAEWTARGRAGEYLWRGTRLARALELQTSGDLRLEGPELQFLLVSNAVEAQQRAAEEARRRRQMRWAIAFGATVTLLLIGAVYQYFEALRQGNQALGRKLAADSERVRTVQRDESLAALLGVESLRRAETVHGFDALWQASKGIARPVARLDSAGERLVFSPDGTLVATGSTTRIKPDLVQIYEARTGRRLARVVVHDRVNGLAFSGDGKRVAAGMGFLGPSIALVLNAATGAEVARFQFPDPVQSVALNADGSLLATGSGAGDGGMAHVIDVSTRAELTAVAHRNEVDAIAFGQGTRVVSGSQGEILIFETRRGVEPVRASIEGIVATVAFSPDGAYVVATSSDAAAIFDATTGTLVVDAVGGASDRTTAGAFSPDGTLVAIGSATVLRRYSVPTWRPLTFIGRPSRAFGFSADGARLVTESGILDAYSSGWVPLGDVPSGAVTFSRTGELMARGPDSTGAAWVFEARVGRDGAVFPSPADAPAALSADGTWAVGSSGVVRISGLPAGRQSSTRALPHFANAFAFGPEGTSIAAAMGMEGPGEVRILETATGRELTKLPHEQGVFAVAFSADGTLLVTGSGDPFDAGRGVARVFELPTGREMARVDHPSRVTAAAVSRDGSLFATGARDGGRVFDARTGRSVATLTQPSWMQIIAFSPNGSQVAGGLNDKTARLFEVRTGREVFRVTMLDVVTALDFTEDGRLLAIGDKGGAVRVVDTSNGGEIARLTLEPGLRQIDFVSGDRLLRALTGDRNVKITQDPIVREELIRDACSKLTRNLTRDEWVNYLGDTTYRETCPRSLLFPVN